MGGVGECQDAPTNERGRSLLGTGPELLYNRFTSKDQTSILAQVLKGKVDFLGFSHDFPMISYDFLRLLPGK